MLNPCKCNSCPKIFHSFPWALFPMAESKMLLQGCPDKAAEGQGMELGFQRANAPLYPHCFLLSRKLFVDLALKPQRILQKGCRQWTCSQQKGCCKLWGFVVSSSSLLMGRRTGPLHVPLTPSTHGQISAVFSSLPICEIDPFNTQ